MRNPYTYTTQKFKVNFGNILYFSSPQADWNQEDETAADYIKNKPNLIAGDNILLEKEGNDIIISTIGTVVPDEPDNPDNPDIPDEPDTPETPDTPDVPDTFEEKVEVITQKALPFYTGLGESYEEVSFSVLDGTTANYTDIGFYVIKEPTKQEAGYQLTYPGSTTDETQFLMIPEETPVINSYQYQPALNQWLAMGFDETYWIYTGQEKVIINGEEVVYNKYVYNSELWGDPILITEYWRFEVEV